MRVGYLEVADYDDRLKATLWELLEEHRNERGGGDG